MKGFDATIGGRQPPEGGSTDLMAHEGIVSPRLKQALELAIRLHGNETRKESPVPLLAHLLGVCALVQHDGGTEEEAIAALLHDSLEDKPELITVDDIAGRFGKRVAEIVTVATDTAPDYRGGQKGPWRQRKERYLETIRTSDPSLLRVTVADKVDNLRAILSDYARLGELFWARFSAPKRDQLWYYRTALEAYRTSGFTGALLLELERLVRQLEDLSRREEQK
jgi:(p)ppGpp synthase/HD superfamily hydrolase